MSGDVRELVLTALIFHAALSYASVGHGGASGYLAAMALAGIPVAVMRPSALVLNILGVADLDLQVRQDWSVLTPSFLAVGARFDSVRLSWRDA